MSETKKIGISLKFSIIYLIIGLVAVFFPRNVIHPFIIKIGFALYFLGVLGLFLNFLIGKLKLKKDIIVLPISLLSTFTIMFMTFLLYNSITASNIDQIELDGQTTNAMVKKVTETLSRRGHKRIYVDIEYTANGKIYNPTLDFDGSDHNYYEQNDTLTIKYSKKDPNLFEIVANSNKYAQADAERLLELLKKGTD